MLFAGGRTHLLTHLHTHTYLVDITHTYLVDIKGYTLTPSVAHFEQSIPVWNRLSYPTYVGIQNWQKIVLIRNQYILHTYIKT